MRLITGNHHVRAARHRRLATGLPTSPHRPSSSAAGTSTPPAHRRASARSARPSSLRRRLVAATLLGLTAATALVLLSGSTARAETVTYVALAQTVDQVLTNIRNWIMGILAGIALVFFTIGGLRYLMAGGNPGEVDKAKDAFKAAGIGFGLAALAPIAVEILKTIVGGL